MNYYYADSANQPVGPIPLERLHALARDGTIGPDTHVLPEGGEDWQHYRSVSPPFPPSAKSLVPIGRNSPIVEMAPPTLAASKTCPFCAEPIAEAAKKCKHCGETIDVALRAAEEAKRASQHQPNVYMNAGGGAVTGGAAVQKRNFPHLIHFLVTLFTLGLWLPIWILHYLGRDRTTGDVNDRNG